MSDFYSGLRCRPGDLAVIIMDEPECQANIGQIVEVLHASNEFAEEMGFFWEVQPLSEEPSPVVISGRGDPALNRYVVHDNGPRAHLDAWLSPLRPESPAQTEKEKKNEQLPNITCRRTGVASPRRTKAKRNPDPVHLAPHGGGLDCHGARRR